MFFDCDNIREQKSGQNGKYHVNVYFSKSYLISVKARTFNSFCILLTSVNKSAQLGGEFRYGCGGQDFSRILVRGRPDGGITVFLGTKTLYSGINICPDRGIAVIESNGGIIDSTTLLTIFENAK